jgi:CBS domain-containing protein
MPSIESVMARDPACCTGDDGVIECARLMERDNVGMIPVVESLDTRKLVGVVTDRDLCIEVVARALDPNEVTVEECMTDELVAVGASDDIERALDLMRQHQVRRLPVVDEDGACVGVVGQGDLAQAVAAGRAKETRSSPPRQ